MTPDSNQIEAAAKSIMRDLKGALARADSDGLAEMDFRVVARRALGAAAPSALPACSNCGHQGREWLCVDCGEVGMP